MCVRFLHHWGLDYLLVRSEQWKRMDETHFLRRSFEVLDLQAASCVLDEMALSDPRFLRQLGRELLGAFPYQEPAPRSREEACQDKCLREGLERQLGMPFCESGKPPPRTALLYICRRKRVARAREPLPDPWKDIRAAMDAARAAPRGYLTVEALTEGGAPVSNLRLEVLLADGDVRTRSTDAAGRLHLDGIPQGRYHIRVPALDGSAWSPK